MNESTQRLQDKTAQPLSEEEKTPGVIQEYFLGAPRRSVAITDTRLVSIAERWNALPQTLRNKLERLCLQGFTKTS